jgi:hypothetical protein
MGISQRCLPRVAAALVLSSLLSAGWGCTEAKEPAVEPIDRTLGTEIYLLFCEHVSGTLYPNDVRGRMTRKVCERGEPDPNGATRLDAMRLNRARIVSALDAILADDAYAQDELTGFVRSLIPLFDVPAAYLPNATDAIADVVDSLRADPAALEALERVSGRQGYRPLDNALGTLTAVFRYPRLKDFLLAFTKELQAGGVAEQSWAQLVDAVGMELAVYRPASPRRSSRSASRDRRWLRLARTQLDRSPRRARLRAAQLLVCDGLHRLRRKRVCRCRCERPIRQRVGGSPRGADSVHHARRGGAASAVRPA